MFYRSQWFDLKTNQRRRRKKEEIFAADTTAGTSFIKKLLTLYEIKSKMGEVCKDYFFLMNKTDRKIFFVFVLASC